MKSISLLYLKNWHDIVKFLRQCDHEVLTIAGEGHLAVTEEFYGLYLLREEW